MLESDPSKPELNKDEKLNSKSVLDINNDNIDKTSES